MDLPKIHYVEGQFFLKIRIIFQLCFSCCVLHVLFYLSQLFAQRGRAALCMVTTKVPSWPFPMWTQHRSYLGQPAQSKAAYRVLQACLKGWLAISQACWHLGATSF